MSRMKITKQIFLDLDGPLLDGKERHYRCYRRILESFGFEPIGLEEYWEGKRALVNRRDLLNMSNAGRIYDDFLGAWLALIESAEMLDLDSVQYGAVECLQTWKNQGIEITLVTMRKNKNALEAQLVSRGLRRLLNAVLVCDHSDGGIGKANAALKSFHGNLRKEDAVWIGDTEVDWEAAKSLECDVVLLSNGLRNEPYLRTFQGATVKPSIAALKDSFRGRSNVD